MTDNTTLETSTEDLLWPRYTGPEDLAAIEAVPLEARGLPESTYALRVRAATRWPERTAITVLPDAARWREPSQRTYSDLLVDVHKYANLRHELGVRRADAVALIAPNCAELIRATLAAQLVGIVAPINGGLSHECVAELLHRSGARVLIAAGPELEPDTWTAARELAARGLLDALLVLRPTAAPEPPPTLPGIGGVRIGYLDTLAAESYTSGRPRSRRSRRCAGVRRISDTPPPLVAASARPNSSRPVGCCWDRSAPRSAGLPGPGWCC